MPSWRATKIWLIIWCFVIIPDVVAAGGIPMIMQFRGGYNYTEFGIPTYHGIVNMLFLLFFRHCIIIFFYQRKIILLIILLMSIWEMLVFRRGILMSGLVEIFFLFLSIKNSLKRCLFIQYFL